MNQDQWAFGEYITQKRKERGITAREMAEKLGISAVYYCDIEKGRRNALSRDVLNTLCSMFELTKEETEHLYDILGRARNTVSMDLPDYIMEKDIVRAALRTAKDHNVDDKQWEDFIARVTQRKA